MAAKKKKAKKAARKAPARKAKKASRKSGKRPAKKAAAKRPAKKAKKAAQASAKKAPARKASAKKAKPVAKKKKQIVGEGDYAASRAFLKDQAGFVERNKANIPAMGREAEEALDGPGGKDLRNAEATAAARSRDTFDS